MREDIALQVGQSTDSVTVTAEASLLQTESSELVHNVTLSQLDNLPLLTVGATTNGVRDIFAASKLLPGVRYHDSAFAPDWGAICDRSSLPSSTELQPIRFKLAWMARP